MIYSHFLVNLYFSGAIWHQKAKIKPWTLSVQFLREVLFQ